MGGETGDFIAHAFGGGDGDFIDDTFVGVEVKGKTGVVFLDDCASGLFDGFGTDSLGLVKNRAEGDVSKEAV